MLFIVRHGRTAHNASGLLLGRIDPPLDELGRVQAVALAGAIGHVDRVITSPLLRTQETAAAFGVEPIIDERWIELDYGDFDGRPLGEIHAETWNQWRTDLDFRPPNGESLRQLGVRVRSALDDLIADGSAADRTTVIVTHVSPIKAAMAWALGADELVAWRLRLSTGSVTRIDMGPHGPQVVTFNETPSGL